MAPVAAIVLAAGMGKRIGGPKMYLPIDGTTFHGRILDRLAGAGVVRVVTVIAGCEVGTAMAYAGGARLVVNPCPSEGMLSSVRTGVAALGETEGYLVIPVDHPEVALRTYRELLDAFAAEPGSVVRPVRQGRAGHPVIIPLAVARLIPAGDLPGGLAGVIRSSGAPVVSIEIDDPGILINVNTKADLER